MSTTTTPEVPMSAAADMCPVCGTRPIEYVCTAGTDAGTSTGDVRCGPCTMPSAAAWSPIPSDPNPPEVTMSDHTSHARYVDPFPMADHGRDTDPDAWPFIPAEPATMDNPHPTAATFRTVAMGEAFRVSIGAHDDRPGRYVCTVSLAGGVVIDHAAPDVPDYIIRAAAAAAYAVGVMNTWAMDPGTADDMYDRTNVPTCPEPVYDGRRRDDDGRAVRMAD
jgi:hypothetical protein